jgi:hypothetical protein
MHGRDLLLCGMNHRHLSGKRRTKNREEIYFFGARENAGHASSPNNRKFCEREVNAIYRVVDLYLPKSFFFHFFLTFFYKSKNRTSQSSCVGTLLATTFVDPTNPAT